MRTIGDGYTQARKFPNYPKTYRRIWYSSLLVFMDDYFEKFCRTCVVKYKYKLVDNQSVVDKIIIKEVRHYPSHLI